MSNMISQNNYGMMMVAATNTTSSIDPTTLLNQQLASALRTIGGAGSSTLTGGIGIGGGFGDDGQYWEETISSKQIRDELEKVIDPTQGYNTPVQIKCMKWLLANISKGRDVSDFYPLVIKLCSALSLEVRKLVYMYTVQYCNYNTTTREISLLSINSFQRGLNDNESLIRGLALRVLTNLQILDIIQIQILAIQTCSIDTSPYVRKCAANAISKLIPKLIPTPIQIPNQQQQQNTTKKGTMKNRKNNSKNNLNDTTLIMDDEAIATRNVLISIIQHMLDNETSTMVLTSVLTSFAELTVYNPYHMIFVTSIKLQKKTTTTNDNDSDSEVSSSSSSSSSSTDNSNNNNSINENDIYELYRLHKSYRNICHLLSDMDEWGQVIVIDILTRYCRIFFKRPITLIDGTAERIDKQRRVRRPTLHLSYSTCTSTITTTNRSGIQLVPIVQQQQIQSFVQPVSKNKIPTIPISTTSITPSSIPGKFSDNIVTLPPRTNTVRKIKRRIVKKGFYSDEEDESTEEEVDVIVPATATATAAGTGITTTSTTESTNNTNSNTTLDDTEDSELSKDHRILLQSAMPLLKSRNGAVVLAVCSLQYYCGVASVTIRAAMGKALVRVVHTAKIQIDDISRREVQYIVLNTIRQLSIQCPSAFTPYLHDFFIHPTTDPHFTRRIKLDILVQLALEPSAIEVILNELRSYIRIPTYDSNYNNNSSGTSSGIGGVSKDLYQYSNDDDDDLPDDLDDDIQFACLSIRAVARVAEMTRIVFDRHSIGMSSSSSSAVQKDRSEANRILLNCLYGLIVLSEQANIVPPIMIGETIVAMQQILHLLQSTTATSSSVGGEINNVVDDPNGIQERTFRRIVLFLIHTLNEIPQSNVEDDEETEDDDDDDNDVDPTSLMSRFRNLCESTVIPARATAAAMSIIGEIVAPYSLQCQSYIASFGKFVFSTVGTSTVLAQYRYEIARLLARAFLDCTPCEKLQAIHYASRILVSNKDSVLSKSNDIQYNPLEVPICEHVLSIGRLDTNPDVRDRARFESNVLYLSVGLQYDRDNIEDDNPAIKALAPSGTGTGGPNDSLLDNLLPTTNQTIDNNSNYNNNTSKTKTQVLTLEDAKRIFLSIKPPCSSIPIAHEDIGNTDAEMKDSSNDDGETSFRFGTLSSLIGHRARSSYVPLPPWANENSPDSLREPPVQVQRNVTTPFDSTSGGATTNGTTQQATVNEFYNSASSDESSSSESDDADVDDDASSSSSSSSDSDIVPQRPGTAMTANVVNFFETTSPQPKQVKVETVSSSSSSSSSDDSSSDDDNAPQELLFPNTSTATVSAATLIPNIQDRNSVARGKAGTGSSSSSTYAGNDLTGLVWTTPASASANSPGSDVSKYDFGGWINLVKPEHSGGLSVLMRYVRGVTKAQQVQLMGLIAEKSSVVCIQIRFENMRTDNNPLRHIRIISKSIGSSSLGSTIGPRKVVLAPEINQLPVKQTVECYAGIDFTSVSDREGSMVAKVEVKHGTSGVIPVEIKPSLGELLLPCVRSMDEFNTASNRMQGFQRLESTFTISSSTKASTTIKSDLLGRILTSIALTPVDTWIDNQLRLTSTLPSSLDHVYVIVQIPAKTPGDGRLTVCCDQAVALNTIMNLLRKVTSVYQ